MKLQEENKVYILTEFSKMKTKLDFLALLNYAKSHIYGKKSFPFEIKNINYYCDSRTNNKRYNYFIIKKKSGADRIIHSPEKGLKAIQKCLNLIFQVLFDAHPAANGFIPEKSIVDNAKIHIGSWYVYNIDLKDFFPSIEAGRVWARLQHPPFNLSEKNNKKDLANIITWLCCHEMEVERQNKDGLWEIIKKQVLPQGAPTSPTLSNIICHQLDFYLTAIAKRFGLKYSRYADDITFSSLHNVYQKKSEFIKELHRIIESQKFHIKQSKTRLQKDGFRQEVTGLTVNTNVNVNQDYIKQLRLWLYNWEKRGYEKASKSFLPVYLVDKGHTKKGMPNMANVIAGKLDYLKMVKGNENDLYLKLKGRFDLLIGLNDPINNIIDIWEKEGVDKAMLVYYKKNNLSG